MMIRRQEALIWFSLQLAIAVGGAVGSIIGPWAGVLVMISTAVINFFAVQKAWAERETPENNKPLADGIAVIGLGLFGAIFFQINLVSALCILLYCATLALTVQMISYRKFYLAQVTSFIFILGGATEANSGLYLIVMSAYCLLAAFSLTEAWLDKSEHGEIAKGPSLGQRSKTAWITMAIAVVIYLLIPRLDALNFGGQESSSPDFYHNQAWEKEANKEQNNTHKDPYNNPNNKKNSHEKKSDKHQTYEDLQELTELSDFGDETKDTYSYSGFNEKFDVRDSNRAGTLDLNTIVARMKAPHGIYLKIRTFDTFDGLSWSSSNEDISRKLWVDYSGEVTLNSGLDGNFQQVITIEENIPAWLPLASDPVTLWLPASAVALDQYGHPLLPGILMAGTRYTVLSELSYRDNRIQARGTEPQRSDRQIPRHSDPRIKALAQELTTGLTDNYEKAKALEHHLRSSYDYSFESIIESQGRTPLAEFLFETKKGHCEYFASAMTIMLRSLGIPARLVTGFSATTQNPLTGYFEIRAIDGHAWSEAWIDGRWVTFEPTAYCALPKPEKTPFTAEQISQYAQDVQKRAALMESGDVTFWSVISGIWLTVYTVVVTLLAYLKLVVVSVWPLWLILILIAAVALITRHKWLPEVRARISQKKIERYQPQQPQAALHYYLYHLQQIALRHTEPRQLSQSLDDWLHVLTSHYGDIPALETLCQLSFQSFYQGNDIAVDDIRAAAIASANAMMTGNSTFMIKPSKT